MGPRGTTTYWNNLKPPKDFSEICGTQSRSQVLHVSMYVGKSPTSVVLNTALNAALYHESEFKLLFDLNHPKAAQHHCDMVPLPFPSSAK